MSLNKEWPEARATAVGRASPSRRHRVHPASWVAAAVLLPLVCWDARQAQRDIQVRRQHAAQAPAHLAREPAPGPNAGR